MVSYRFHYLVLFRRSVIYYGLLLPRSYKMASNSDVTPRTSILYVKTAIINGSGKANVMIDFGTYYTFIKKSEVERLNLKVSYNQNHLLFGGVSNTFVAQEKIHWTAEADISIDKTSIGSIKMYVHTNKNIVFDILVGRDWLEHPNINYRKERGHFLISPRSNIMRYNIAPSIKLGYFKEATINKRHKIKMLIDTGSKYSLIKKELAVQYNLVFESYYITLFGVDDSVMTIKYRSPVEITVDGVSVKTFILIVENMVLSGIIGRQFLDDVQVGFRKGDDDEPLIIYSVKSDI